MISLANRLKNELDEIQKTINQIDQFLKRLDQEKDEVSRMALSTAIAFNLHSFYTGTERMFEAIAKRIDQYKPSGDNWHRQLLAQMLVNLPDLRCPVISENTYLVLDELRKFRHVVRGIYAYELDEERILSLAEKALRVFPSLQQDIETLITQSLTPDL